VKTGLNKIWGTIRPTTTEKKEMIARLKQELGAEQIVKGDRAQGRLIFSKTCATCHTLFDSGGNVGPDLTGAQRTNLDYVLSNVVDPSAVVAKDYQVNVFATVDGRVISGIIKSEDARIVKIQTANEIIVVPIADVESRKATPNSLMPEGLLTGWKPEEVRNLMSYLAGSGQVAVPSEGAR
jgi:putative heme-binding domain-containing protein